ncbi:MAG: carboxypeptidase regulatory-like domain-containing protein [Candidatus Coatesbacteria bacterium]|nr:MAG: carboxypeptidase regulatory-like domain-containing protein [Candidatus Coatesbacteria bacterium]
MLRDVPRGVEVLVKKAAVDPSFKKLLLQRRAEAAEAIALTLSAAEEAMLAAVPEAQLRAIIASTKVSPSLRPAFLGYAAAAMLAALSAGAYADEAEDRMMRPTGIEPDIPPKVYDRDINDPQDIDVPDDAGVIYGRVSDQHGDVVPGVVVEIDGLDVVTVSNRHGFYVLTPIPPGTYNLTFQAEGYLMERRSQIEVREGVKTDVSVKIIMGIQERRITGIRPELP